VEVAPGGPELPSEFTLASLNEIDKLRGVPVGMLGFPGTDSKGVPPPGKKPLATYHDGVISRLTDFNFDNDVPWGHLQFVQHTILDWGGFSGSPIFLPNGRVVAIHNWARSEVGPFKDVRVIPHGIRVDCLWELLAHHNLTDKVASKFDVAKLNIKRWFEDDPRDLILRKVIAIVAQANYEVYTRQDFEKGIELCNQAMKMVPNYAEAYNVRGDAYTNTWFNNRRRLSRKAAANLLLQADEDYTIYAKLEGSNSINPYLSRCVSLNNLGSFTEDNKYNAEALGILEKLWKLPNLDYYQKARILSSSAIALDNLNEDGEASQKHLEAIRMAPDEAVFWENRAQFWEFNPGFRNAADLRRSDLARAKLLRENRYGKGLTWTVILNEPGELTRNDQRGRVRQGAYYKIQTVKLEKGRTYQIEMYSDTLDTYMRLEDPNGNNLAEDDDNGGNLDAMIFFQPTESGTYRIVATSCYANHLGNYRVKVQEGR
jgi:tetratricopeptide (TPR) repeat protein